MSLSEKIESIRAMNTHSHHEQSGFFDDFNLEKILVNSYVSWCGAEFDETPESRQAYLNKVRYKSYFVWIQKALKRIYGMEENLSAQNWDEYSQRIKTAYADKSFHIELLKNECRYDKVIIDAYWNPGSREKDELFTSTFRLDPLFFGYNKQVKNHNGLNASELYGESFSDIDGYIDFTRRVIERKVKQGCVSLKNAMAYDRTIEYKKTSKSKAERVFKNATEENIRYFQDYLFWEICDIAAGINVPIQCHTGLGLMKGSNAMGMRDIILDHPDTKFVIFHGGFPWTDDYLALMHYFSNVYADICWLPILSVKAAEYVLHALIEICTSDKITWGCDTRTSEESLGARLAMESVLTTVLSEKIADGYFSESDAEAIALNMLANNPKALYGL